MSKKHEKGLTSDTDHDCTYGIVARVIEGEDYYEILDNQSTGFGLNKKYGVVPKVGDFVRVYAQLGYTIRGIAFATNDGTLTLDEVEASPLTVSWNVAFYNNYEQQEELDKIARKEADAKRKEDFEKNKSDLDAKYDALPDAYKARIDRLRRNNPNFREKYESYELFVCEQAIDIAAVLKSRKEIEDFHSLDFEEQQKIVPTLDGGHSGNTFGMACTLAMLSIERPDLIDKYHGALCGMVGCEDYGCCAAYNDDGTRKPHEDSEGDGCHDDGCQCCEGCEEE